ncbi:MAG: NAD-binding protein, partial [bacterium]
EFASIFSNFGNTDVRLIARDDRILPFEDEDLTKIIERNLEKSGVTIHRQSSLISMKIVSGEVEYVIGTPQGEETHQVERA